MVDIWIKVKLNWILWWFGGNLDKFGGTSQWRSLPKIEILPKFSSNHHKIQSPDQARTSDFSLLKLVSPDFKNSRLFAHANYETIRENCETSHRRRGGGGELPPRLDLSNWNRRDVYMDVSNIDEQLATRSIWRWFSEQYTILQYNQIWKFLWQNG